MVETSLVQYVELGVVTVGIILALLQLRDLNKTRMLDVIWRIGETTHEKEFMQERMLINALQVEDYENWLTAREDLAVRIAYNRYANFLYRLCLLVEFNLIDFKILQHYYGNHVTRFWNKYGPIIRETRARTNRPRLWYSIEETYNRLIEVYERKHPGVYSDTSHLSEPVRRT